MVNRLANFAHHQLMNSHLFKLQSNLFDAQIAVSTEKKTQQYAGIPDQSERLVRLEHLLNQSENFISNNEVADLRMQSTDISLVGVEETITNMYDMISDYSSGELRDAEQVEQVQKFAFQALRDIQGFLNESVAGRYIFSGSRTSVAPVDLNLGESLSDFQSKWNGDTSKFPETRDAHIAEFGVASNLTFTEVGTANNQAMRISIAGYAPGDYDNFKAGGDIDISGGTSNDGNWTISSVDTTTGFIEVKRKELTTAGPSADSFVIKRGSEANKYISASVNYDATAGTIAAPAGTFSDVAVPSTMEITSGTANNTMTVTITDVSADGSTVTVDQKVATVPGGAEAGTITVSNYYNGDLMTTNHRVDENRTIDFNINGLNPAFDKAIRALSIIAQGEFGTSGGLDQNTERAEEALWLLDSALDSPTDGKPPYGPEDNASVEQLRFNTAFDRQQMKNSIERERTTINFLQTSISGVEDINLLEATTELLDLDRALQASYQVISRTQKLGLSNFL